MQPRYASVTLVAPATAERTFRIFRATPRRTAAQNAARFIARVGERAIGFRRVKYDGVEMIAVNYFGANPRPVIRLRPAKVWSREFPSDNLSVVAEYVRRRHTR